MPSSPGYLWVHALRQQAASLLLYSSVLENQVGQTLNTMLAAMAEGRSETIAPSDSQEVTDPSLLLDVLPAYGDLFTALAARQQSWQQFVVQAVLEADNPFTQGVQRQPLEDLPPELLDAARHDLQVLQDLWQWNGDGLVEAIQELGGPTLPPLAGSTPLRNALQGTLFTGYDNWAEALPALANYHRQFGCGQMAQYRAFSWSAGQLQGYPYPDGIAMDELVGYEDQRDQLIKNTEALLLGYPALNILLYGSRGAGKSAMIKALLPLYGNRGLRLIEIRKSVLIELPQVLAHLQNCAQKFIIFVDDLSFEEDEESYKALKVVLEGNIAARPKNVIVYATSNRRHLIREFFEDRPRPSQGDEIHAWDTVQEKLSLSDRFGLTLTFEPANQDTYLRMVFHLARRSNLDLAPEELKFRALQWATRHNGRSGRTARQFIDFLQAELALSADLG
ncbi:ATP-binding protein [Acaryochloris sp. IP29b_bin.148]|uniref:ATP-binding protein n=1 Tax=Acaryochloris sp. IP29b_bin.148 TaxID=2969218 RepID=UPI002613787A|nr:ATP-binding protein [Acaryochloris sp. IP29b_bin.148]